VTWAALGRTLVWGFVAYAGLCLLVFVVQRSLMYFPERATEKAALERAAFARLRPWRDPQGMLIGWRPARAAEARDRILVFHGNAGSALDRVYYLAALGGPTREVVLFEYPGYGARPGKPGQPVLVNAALAAVERLHAEGDGPVWLLGESLGSGVAAQVAAREPAAVSGLILVTPVARMAEVAASHYPWLPVRALLRDRWDNLTALRAYHGPVVILVAGRDEVVGAPQGRRLAQSLSPAPRVFEQPEAGHNSVDVSPGADPWPQIRAIVDTTPARPASSRP
jgi:uncharacterized protein